MLLRLLIGRPLASGEPPGRKIGVPDGAPAIGLDPLAPSAYVSEAGLAVAAAAQLFVACFLGVIGFGVGRAWGDTPALAPPAPAGASSVESGSLLAGEGGGTSSVSLWLLLRAFASGCTAMTGVEAV